MILHWQVLAPLVQAPSVHTSLAVHALPSSHAILLVFLCKQPPDASQVSVVQTLLSSQPIEAPTHLPNWQESPCVQALLSLHAPLFNEVALQMPLAASHTFGEHISVLTAQVTTLPGLVKHWLP